MQKQYTPNWYLALQEHAWTVRNILREFAVPRAIAQDIQRSFLPYEAARAMEQAHKELVSQTGH